MQEGKTKGIHWQKVGEGDSVAIQTSIWGNSTEGTSLISQDDQKLLEEIFAKKAKKEEKEKEKDKDGKEKAAVLQALDPGREKNIGIVLQFMRLPLETIKTCVMNMDSMTLQEDTISGLLTIAPTPEDTKAVAPFVNGGGLQPGQVLSIPVKFVIMTMQVSRFSQRLSCWLTAIRFGNEIVDIETKFKKVINAAEAAMRSRLLAVMLQYVLGVGNVLNQGTNNRDARAFKISDLTKFCSLRTTDNKRTLLSVLVELVNERNPEGHKFSTELESIHPALQVDVQQVQTELRDLRSKVQACAGLTTSLSTEQVVQQKLGPFVADAVPKIEQAEKLQVQCVDTMNRLAPWFLEDPKKFSFLELIKSLSCFCREYDAELQQHIERQKRRERLAAKEQKDGKDKGQPSEKTPPPPPAAGGRRDMMQML